MSTSLFTVALWVVNLRMSRNAWRAAERSISAYVDLQVRRYQQQINGIRSGTIVSLLLSTCVLIINLRVLKTHHVRLPLGSIIYFWTVGIVVNCAVLSGQMAKKQKLQSELNNLLDVQRAIS